MIRRVAVLIFSTIAIVLLFRFADSIVLLTFISNPIRLSIGLLKLLIVILVLYTLAKPSQKKWFSEHQGMLSLAGILVAAILFFLPGANQYMQSANAIALENSRNRQTMDLFIRELNDDPSVPLWLNIQREAYSQYRTYIDLYGTQACREAYLNLAFRLDNIENINRRRQEMQLENQGAAFTMGIEMINMAEATQNAYREIDQKCPARILIVE